jgi:hypothetical protein
MLIYANLHPRPDLAHRSSTHEHLRRRVENGITELAYAMRKELDTFVKTLSHPSEANQQSAAAESIVTVKRRLIEQYRTLMADAIRLSRVDGADQDRRQELAAVHTLVQSRFEHLQNPANCSAVQKLVCNLNKGQDWVRVRNRNRPHLKTLAHPQS